MKAKIGEIKSKVGGFFGKIGGGIKSAVGSEINKRKAKASKVKESVGGFFSKVGKGIKNIGSKAISMHPAVIAGKAIKNKLSDSKAPKVSSKAPVINKSNKSIIDKIASVRKQANYEKHHHQIVEVPVMIKAGGGSVQGSTAPVLGGSGGESGNDPYEVLDFQG